MASELFIKGKQLTGAVGNALKINCKDKDGNKSTVQAELNKFNENLVADDGAAFRFGVNENGEYGYIVTDEEGADSVIPFKRDMKNVKIQFNASSISNLTIGNTYFIAMGNFQSTNNTGTISSGGKVLYSSNWVNSGSAYNNFYYIGRFYIVKATDTTLKFAGINGGWSHVIYFDMNGLVFDNITYIK